MKTKKRKLYWGIGFLCLFLLGCAKEKIAIESGENSFFLQESETHQEEATEEKRAESKRPEETDALEKAKEEEASTDAEEEAKTLWVHICGEVALPGVYQLPEGARVWDALQKAGGVTDKAQADYLNQASPLADGMKITVPSKDQVLQWEASGETGLQVGQESSLEADPAKGAGEAEGAKVNLNTADEATLCTLPGIGTSRARSIIAYRQENGPFARIEDIMNVTGIKEAAFAKIKDYICVS